MTGSVPSEPAKDTDMTDSTVSKTWEPGPMMRKLAAGEEPYGTGPWDSKHIELDQRDAARIVAAYDTAARDLRRLWTFAEMVSSRHTCETGMYEDINGADEIKYCGGCGETWPCATRIGLANLRAWCSTQPA